MAEEAKEETKTEVQISFEKGVVEKMLVTPLGADLYRLEETPFSGDASYHDVIEAVATEEGFLEFRGIRESSPLRRYDFLLPKDLAEAPLLKALLDRVKAEGGNWEKVMGTLFYIYLTPESEMDPDREIDLIIEELSNS